MADITLSSAVRNNLLSLQNTSSLLETTQNRLATGQRVNSALDDPSAFFTASSLNSRAGDLNRLLDSVGLAVQTVEAADKGISSITDLVEAAQASARNALQAASAVTTAATVTGTGAAIQPDAAAATTPGGVDISGDTDLLAGGTNVNQGDTFDISDGTTTITVTFGTGIGEVDTTDELLARINDAPNLNVDASLSNGGQLVLTGADADTTVTVDTGAASAGQARVTAALGFAQGSVATAPTNLISQGAVAANDTLTFQVGGATSTITFGNGNNEVSTLEELGTALQGLAGTNGIGTASIDATGNITVTAANTTDTVTAGGTATIANFGLTTDTAEAVTTANGTRAAAENEFNNLLSQIDQLAADASFNGNNLLAGDNLTVIFNEDGSSSLAVTGVNFNSTGLGVSTVASESFQNDANINTTLGELDSAISTLRTQAATFGSNLSVVQIRQDFTKNLINTLETGAAGLTLADANQEAANVLALQTRQSLSSSSLSLASRSDQSVLQLLR